MNNLGVTILIFMIVIIVLLVILVLYQLQQNNDIHHSHKYKSSRRHDHDVDIDDRHSNIIINNSYGKHFDDVRESHDHHLRKVSHLRRRVEHASKGVTETDTPTHVNTRLRPVYAHHYAKFVDPDMTIATTTSLATSNDVYEEELINVPLLGVCREDTNCALNLECQGGVCRHPVNPNTCPVRTTIDTSDDKTGLTGTITQTTGLCSEGHICINNGNGVGGTCAALAGQPCVVSSNCASGTCQTDSAVIFTRNATTSAWTQETVAPDFFDKIVSHPVNPYQDELSQQAQLSMANASSLENDVLWGLISDNSNNAGIYRRESNGEWRRLLPTTIIETMPSPEDEQSIIVQTFTITDLNVTREGQPVFTVHILTEQDCEDPIMRDALFTLLSTNDAGPQFTELDFEYMLGSTASTTTSNKTTSSSATTSNTQLLVANIRNLEINPYGDMLIIADSITEDGTIVEEGVLLVKAANSSAFIRIAEMGQEVSLARFYSGMGKADLQLQNIGYVTTADPGIVQFFGIAEGQIYPQFTIQGQDNNPVVITDFFAEPVADQADLRTMGSPTLHILLNDGYEQKLSSVFDGIETTLPGYFGTESLLHISQSGRFYVQATGTCA